MRRVVVTGLGAITPIGNNVPIFWNNLISGKVGIDKITRFDTDSFPVKLAAEVKDLDVSSLPKRETKFDAIFVNYARLASHEAWNDAGLDMKKEDAERVGVFIATSLGGNEKLHDGVVSYERKGAARVSPYLLQSILSNMAAAKVSIDLGAHGSSMGHIAACASGGMAIGAAYTEIALKETADVMIAGASDASIEPVVMASFAAMRAIYTGEDATIASVPFDRRRSGFTMGEGAGILVLEELEHAKSRGAKIYAELIGEFENSDAYHAVSPDLEGRMSQKAMEHLLRRARVNAKRIGYINAHGTSTPIGDKVEAMAIERIWGEKSPYVSSIKAQIGHLLSASGAVEAIATILSLKDGILPATANSSDIDCDINLITDKPVRKKIDYAISNSFGFGGHNVCLLFKRWNEK